MLNGSGLQALILAAGKSTRFKTEKSKLGFLICGQAMIAYPVKLLHALEIPVTLIVGHQWEAIKDAVDRTGIKVDYVKQSEQKGTGHAVACSRTSWFAQNILIMGGDAPLVTQEIINELIDAHRATDAAITFATAHNEDLSLRGYGRIVHEAGSVSIMEECDLGSHDVHKYCCVNAGIYIIKREFLQKYIDTLVPSASGELYLTDIVKIANRHGLKIETVAVPFDTIRGVNTLKELWVVEHIKRSELIAYWMSQGVRFSTAQNSHIDVDVVIGPGTFVGAGVLLIQGTRIGSNCWIDAFSFLSNAIVHDDATILPHSVVYDSTICSKAKVGPFAHIRKGSIIGQNSCIGNFVEVSATTMDVYAKAKHLAYLGNTSIGSYVNVGAGAVTCNYDGVEKHSTIICDGAFIGSNSSLIAPVTIGKEALVAAGSTITKDVPDNALAIARAQQVIKECGALVRREKIKDKKEKDLAFESAHEIEHESICMFKAKKSGQIAPEK